MKYLKTFENINLGDRIILKKYVIWEMRLVLIILENQNNSDSIFQRLYIYNKESDNIRETDKKTFYFSPDEIKEHVVYQSDNLEDCLNLNRLKYLKDQYESKQMGKKYNL